MLPSSHISSVQLLNHVRFFVTPWTTAHQASLSITNSQSLPKPMSIESGVGDATQPSHPSLSPSPPALNLSQHRGLLKWVSSSTTNKKPSLKTFTTLFSLNIYFFKKIFIFSCAEFSLLRGLFSGCGEPGLLSRCSARASHCGGFPRGRARARGL